MKNWNFTSKLPLPAFFSLVLLRQTEDSQSFKKTLSITLIFCEITQRELLNKSDSDGLTDGPTIDRSHIGLRKC